MANDRQSMFKDAKQHTTIDMAISLLQQYDAQNQTELATPDNIESLRDNERHAIQLLSALTQLTDKKILSQRVFDKLIEHAPNAEAAASQYIELRKNKGPRTSY